MRLLQQQSESKSSRSIRALLRSSLAVAILLIAICPNEVHSFTPTAHFSKLDGRRLLKTNNNHDQIRMPLNHYCGTCGNNMNRDGVKLHLFRRIFRRDNNNNDDDDDDENDDENLNDKKKKNQEDEKKSEDTDSTLATLATLAAETNPETALEKEETIKPQLSALEQAQMLRAQAEKTRLEAEKMDILLTLQKIEKLESELEKLNNVISAGTIDGDKTSTTNNSTPKTTKIGENNKEDLIQQIKVLKKKLNGDHNSDERENDKPVQEEGESENQSSSLTTSSSTTTTTTPAQSRVSVGSVVESVIEEATTAMSETTTTDIATVTAAANNTITTTESPPLLSNEELEKRVNNFNKAPEFMKELVVNAVGSFNNNNGKIMKLDDESFNVTELILQMEKDSVKYKNESGGDKTEKTMPTFTQEQIDEVVDAVELVPQFVKNMYGDEIKNNDTAIALLMLEDEWKNGKIVEMPEITQDMIDRKLEEVKWVPQFLRGDNDTELALELIRMDFKNNPRKFREEVLGEKSSSDSDQDEKESKSSESALQGIFGTTRLFGGNDEKESEEGSDESRNVDSMIESLFPPTTRREGEEPTEKDIKIAMTDVFAKDNTWTTSGQPVKVSGGYLVRGYAKYESGKELMEAINKNLEKSNIKDQVSIFYVFDPTPVTDEQMEGGERPPLLFVTGANVVRDPAPIVRSIISSLALGTVWYNALVPYLLNDKYMKLADEQLALADASMTANLDFLNDLSTSLFFAFIGIQVVHEVAHKVVASANGMEISFPTLVPSLESGLTGAITSLQSTPKDKQALFDFAIAGPLAAIGVSVVLMYTGMFLTSSMDAAAFSDLPALPLAVLRQSSLAGGIIDSVNPGLLSIPDAALGTKALNDINIPLHPLTIAGFFGLMVNAINLLPAGRTDGGRISLTLFGRSGTQLVSFITYVCIFFTGVLGSDLLLFFFSYLIFFQSELEIPQQNEVDDMDFSRVLLATVTGVLVLLTLIPM